MSFGVDVAIMRTDDLDRRMIEFIKNNLPLKVLDIGSGAGGQSVRMAEAGASVLALDVNDYGTQFEKIKEEKVFSEEQLKFIHADVRSLAEVLDEEFSICCWQRAVHYLTYDEAFEVLSWLRTKVSDKLFISASGLESDIGINYEAKDRSVEDRFASLNNFDQAKFMIYEPVCLYQPEEFMVLLKETGWTIEEFWLSAFGNIKAVCS